MSQGIALLFSNYKLSFVSILFVLVSILVLGGNISNSNITQSHAYFPFERVYADGLTQENLPPASLGDRDGSLFVKINPPVYTTESKENAFMQFRLFDAKTNETINFVTYDITVRKGANPSSDDKPLLRDFFQSPSGLLTLRVDPTNDTSLTIFGNQDPFLGAWISDPGGTINIRGPLLQEGGLYRFDIQVFGIDNPRNIFVPEDAPNFETFLSVGDVYNFEDLQYNGKTFNSTLISYYDEVQDFNFDSETGSFSWAMPFYYNITRLTDNPIFVHEEIKLPKALFGDSTFNATVNGDPVTGRTLAVDPFSDPNSVILHYLINKNDIVQLAENWLQREQHQLQQFTSDTVSDNGSNSNNQTGVMSFVLNTTEISQPAEGQEQQQQQSSSTDLISDTGGLHASVSWSPVPLLSDSNSTVTFNFTDAFSGGPLNADVMYDLVILNGSGTQVINKEQLLAVNSTDTQTLIFPAEGQYQIELHITGLITEGERIPDLTRNGIARGVVIISDSN